MIKEIKKPEICIEVFEIPKEWRSKIWDAFKYNHYLSSELNKSARCFLATWNNIPVAFYAILRFPHRSIKDGWRGHRLVVLPDYQGLGIGNRLSEYVGKILAEEGKRFFTKTANIKLGEYRNKSEKWKITATSLKSGGQTNDFRGYSTLKNNNYRKRICYSHEYVGNKISKYDDRFFAFVFDKKPYFLNTYEKTDDVFDLICKIHRLNTHTVGKFIFCNEQIECIQNDSNEAKNWIEKYSKTEDFYTICKNYVSANGLCIKNISNPSLELQTLAVEQNKNSILHIKTPDHKLIKKVIYWNPCIIRFMDNLPEDLLINAVTKKWYVIKYIKNPSQKLINLAEEKKKKVKL